MQDWGTFCSSGKDSGKNYQGRYAILSALYLEVTMFVLVCYDVETINPAGRKRLRKMAKACESRGQRAQKSVFECKMAKADYLLFEHKLVSIMNPELDSLRIYILDQDTIIKNFGNKIVVDFEEPQII